MATAVETVRRLATGSKAAPVPVGWASAAMVSAAIMGVVDSPGTDDRHTEAESGKDQCVVGLGDGVGASSGDRMAGHSSGCHRSGRSCAGIPPPALGGSPRGTHRAGGGIRGCSVRSLSRPWGVDDRQHFFQVHGQQPVEQHRVVVTHVGQDTFLARSSGWRRYRHEPESGWLPIHAQRSTMLT
jgi:hypothetical protein